MTFFKSGLWDRSDLGKGDQLFRFIRKFRYHGVEYLPQEFLIKSSSVNLDFVVKKTQEITAGAHLLSIAKIVNSVQQIRTGALLILNNYILHLIRRHDSIYLRQFFYENIKFL